MKIYILKNAKQIVLHDLVSFVVSFFAENDRLDLYIVLMTALSLSRVLYGPEHEILIFLSHMRAILLEKSILISWAESEGDRGSGPPLKNCNKLGFLSNTGPDCLKNYKATKPEFNVGPSSARQQNAI